MGKILIMIIVSITIIIILIIFGFWLIIKFGMKPYVHKNVSQNDLKKYLKTLLYRGYDKGFMCIDLPGRKGIFLQLNKYIQENDTGIQLCFPLANWSKTYYNDIKKVLIKQSIPFSIEKKETDNVPVFLIVDFDKDLEMAYRVVKMILQEIFKIGENTLVNLYFENISPREEKVGF